MRPLTVQLSTIPLSTLRIERHRPVVRQRIRERFPLRKNLLQHITRDRGQKDAPTRRAEQ